MPAKKQPKPKDSISTRARKLLAFAQKQAEQVANWVELHNALFGIGGKATSLFPTEADRTALLKTPEYKKVLALFDDLPAPEVKELGDPLATANEAITIRLPRSVHAALLAEAKAEGVSLNQLCLQIGGPATLRGLTSHQREDVGTVALFTWRGSLLPREESELEPIPRYSDDFVEQWAYQACLPVAQAVLKAVRKSGWSTDVEVPYFGEGGWHFTVEIEQRRFSLMILWVPREDGSDGFAVQPTLCRGWFAALFLPRPPHSALQPICDVLRTVLTTIPEIADLEWVSEL